MVPLFLNGEGMRGGRVHPSIAHHTFVGEVGTAPRAVPHAATTRLLGGLWDATETYRAASRLDKSGQETLQAEHQVMLDAFLARDEQRLIEAAEFHRQHLLVEALLGTCPPT